MNEPVVRAADRTDDAGIRALLAACFPDNIKSRAAYTRWQYWDNPFGAARSWVAEAEGRIVSHWAAVPVPMILDGVEGLGAKGVDGATDPAYRGRGLFAELGRNLRRDASAAGIRAILTHPNPDAARGAEQAGAVLISRAAAHVRPLDDAWLGRRARLPGAAGRAAGAFVRRAAFPLRPGDRAEVTAALPEGIDDLWARAGRGVRNGVARHQGWWDWRYAQRPDRPYRYALTRRGGRLSGVACVTVAERFGGRFGLVLEYLAVDEDAARGLTAALSAIATAEQAVGLALVTLPRSDLSALCRGAGFRRLPRRLEPRALRMMVFDPSSDDASALAARRWSMAWGDLDHI